MFDKDTSTWIERGRGQVRLNDLRTQAESGPTVTSRIIMRTAGSLRVILNSKIFPEMTLEKPTEKNIRLTAMDGLVSKSEFDHLQTTYSFQNQLYLYFRKEAVSL